jgi:hypothetical protein
MMMVKTPPSINMLTMALIAQPYSKDACSIGSCASAAVGWAEGRFGID